MKILGSVKTGGRSVVRRLAPKPFNIEKVRQRLDNGRFEQWAVSKDSQLTSFIDILERLQIKTQREAIKVIRYFANALDGKRTSFTSRTVRKKGNALLGEARNQQLSGSLKYLMSTWLQEIVGVSKTQRVHPNCDFMNISKV